MIFDVMPEPAVPEDLTLFIWLGAVAGLIVLILIVYFSYKFIKQKKIGKLMPDDLEKKNEKNEKKEVAEKPEKKIQTLKASSGNIHCYLLFIADYNK